jgi:methylmalonyl-CoA mutase N-terminal domain/subunit
VRYRYLLAQGVKGLTVAFDLPTQIGYDSDHPLAAGEVGRVGVAIDSIEDMSALFDGIPLESVSTSMTINSTAIILLALYVAVARRQGVEPRVLTGTVQNDILKEYAARGTYIYPPGPSLRIVTDIISFCEREVPQWNSISISGYHIREAGSTAVEEVAFTLANACAYVEACLAAGLDVNAFGPRLSFFFNAHNDFLEEIAKFRAARRLWARLIPVRPIRARNCASTPRPPAVLTAQQPANNIVRVALQALSGSSAEPVAALQRQRRSAGAAHRAERDPGAAYAADPAPRKRRGPDRGPLRRRLRDRRADVADRGRGRKPARTDSRPGRDARRARVRLHPATHSRVGV